RDPNAPKHYEAQQNLSSGSNGVDWLRSLRKLPTRLCGTNFCITCTSLAHFASSLLSKQNIPKCTKTLQNAPKREVSVKWGGSGALVAKNYDATSWHDFCINCTSSARFAPS